MFPGETEARFYRVLKIQVEVSKQVKCNKILENTDNIALLHGVHSSMELSIMAGPFSRSRFAQSTLYDRSELIWSSFDVPMFVQILVSQNLLLLAMRIRCPSPKIIAFIFSDVYDYSKSEAFSSNFKSILLFISTSTNAGRVSGE